MISYPKIQGLFKRDEKTHWFIEGEYSFDIFAYLNDIQWAWTEKIDGMNIRVIWHPDPARIENLGGHSTHRVPNGWIDFRGRTDKAELRGDLIEKLLSYFLKDNLLELLGDVPITLYGEGCGAGIQKGGGNYSPTKEFIMFDVYRDFWWDRVYVEELATALGVDIAPLLGYGTLDEAVKFVKEGVKSAYGHFLAEGIVVRPSYEMSFHRGRVITKIKGKDFGV